MGLPYVLTDKTLSVLVDCRSVIIPRSHANFDRILTAINDNDLSAVKALMDVKQAVSDFTSGRIEIRDRVLYFKGRELDTSLTRKIVEFVAAGDDQLADPLMRFLDKVMENPSHRAVTGLFDWVSASKMPIAPDGDFYAWKIVRADYLDYYTRTLDHSPGNTVSQPRNLCDEDPDRTCSAGIHFCSFDYLPSYHAGDDTRRVMLVKINPKDAVAFPRDYNLAKGRCCELTVIQEVPKEELEGFFPTTTVYTPPVAENTETEADPEPKREFEVGATWRDEDGDDHLITAVNDDSVETMIEGFGMYTFNADGRCECSWGIDLIEPVKSANPPITVELGKRYLCRDGIVRSAVSRPVDGDASVTELDSGHMVWTEGGQVNRGGRIESPADILSEFTAWVYQVGQVYQTRSGALLTVTDSRHIIHRGEPWAKFTDGYVRGPRGNFLSGSESPHSDDVVKLIHN